MSTNYSFEMSLHVKESDALMTKEASFIIRWVLSGFACQIVDIFGTVTNIINIICFVKLGFKDSVNVSLLGLAISDLGCLTTVIFTNLCCTPPFQSLDLVFEPTEVQYLVTAWPHFIFTRITGCITALITVERYFCVTKPLQIKRVFTPQRTTIIIITIFILCIICGSPIYYDTRISWKFSTLRNKTLLGLVFTSDREYYEKISFVMNNLFLSYGSFFIIILGTLALVRNLRRKTQWRKRSMTPDQALTTITRDQKVAKMVVVISWLFIACFVPVCLTVIVMAFMPELAIDGEHSDSIFAIAAIFVLLESINSAMNIFVYYHMSSKYRAVFCQLFRVQISKDSRQP